jgi:predicted TIM-barrel fold metal-dependent hydrolase
VQQRDGIDRRTFIGATGGAVAVAAPAEQVFAAPVDSVIPIIDSHIHLFDPARPQGVPYKADPKSPTFTAGAFPPGYKKLAAPLGIVGAVLVEASPWIEDNLWALQTCAAHDVMLGVVGNLKPEDPNFPEYLERHRKNPLFRGIRYGNIWGYDLAAQSRNPSFIRGLELLSQADLVLETANPRIDLLEAVVRISDAVPRLRIVIDHLPAFEPGRASQAAYEILLKEFEKRPNISCKLSAVIHRVDGVVSTRLADHRSRLDLLSGVFGEDRVMFGSDWPNSDATTSLDHIVRIVREYFADKPRAAAENYFWRNSARIHKWTPRVASQPRLG